MKRLFLALLTLWCITVMLIVLGGLVSSGLFLYGLLIGAGLVVLMLVGRATGIRQADASESQRVSDTFS